MNRMKHMRGNSAADDVSRTETIESLYQFEEHP